MENNPRISIVDDDPSVRRALGRLCKSVGYKVNLFASAEEFHEAAAADETDCLILDVQLPGCSGLQLQRDLQTSNKPLPIIFVTAYEDEETRKQALECGAVGFFQKPLDNERLLRALHGALHQ
jgi:FixJ family two-component response regulator